MLQQKILDALKQYTHETITLLHSTVKNVVVVIDSASQVLHCHISVTFYKDELEFIDLTAFHLLY